MISKRKVLQATNANLSTMCVVADLYLPKYVLLKSYAGNVHIYFYVDHSMN